MSALQATIPVTSDARRLVTMSLQKSGLTAEFQRLAAQDARYAEIAARLACYLSRKIRHPHTKKPLLHQCLGDAVIEAMEMPRNATDDDRVACFVEAIVNRLTLVLRYRISRDSADWDPVHGQPLLEWVKHGDFVVESILDISGMVPTSTYKAVMTQRLRGEQAQVQSHRQGVQA